MYSNQKDKYLFDVKNYKVIEEINRGGFAVVNLVENKNSGARFAAKTNLIQNTKQNKLYISREVRILIQVQHPTIIQFQGFSYVDFDLKKNITILMEYMKNGSLADLIAKEERGLCPSSYDNTNRQIILIGIARGMMLLHRLHIIHRDLKPENILLDDDFHPHITDFGLAKFFDPNHSMSQSNSDLGTAAYMAPEVINSEKFNTKADVYSFGILMCEVLTGKRAYTNFFKGKKKISIFQFKQKVCEGLRPEIEEGSIKRSHQIMIEKCLSQNPKDRPTFSELYKKLNLSSEDDIFEFEPQTQQNVIDYESDDDDEIGINKKFCLDSVDYEKVFLYVDDISEEPTCYSNKNIKNDGKINQEIKELKKTISELNMKLDNQTQKNEQMRQTITELKTKLVNKDAQIEKIQSNFSHQIDLLNKQVMMLTKDASNSKLQSNNQPSNGLANSKPQSNNQPNNGLANSKLQSNNQPSNDLTNYIKDYNIKYAASKTKDVSYQHQNISSILGIDLGISNSTVGYCRLNSRKLDEMDIACISIPSVVYIADNKISVGKEAIRLSDKNPKNFIYDSKRMLGKKFNDPIIQEYRKNWAFDIISSDKGEILIKVGDKKYKPYEISGMILIELMKLGNSQLSDQTNQAIITVPAYFTSEQIEDTKRAAKYANIELIDLLKEPLAVIFGYDYKTNNLQSNKKSRDILVYDIGCTLDVSYVDVKGSEFNVLATAGDSDLGGQAFTNSIVEFISPKLDEICVQGWQTKSQFMNTVKKYCENAKIILSKVKEYELYFDIPNDIGKEKDAFLEQDITREEFKQIAKPLFDRCMNPVLDVLNRVKRDPHKIESLVLVGGSSYLPMILDKLKKLTGKEVYHEVSAADAVAFGACVIGGRYIQQKLIKLNQQATQIDSKDAYLRNMKANNQQGSEFHNKNISNNDTNHKSSNKKGQEIPRDIIIAYYNSKISKFVELGKFEKNTRFPCERKVQLTPLNVNLTSKVGKIFIPLFIFKEKNVYKKLPEIIINVSNDDKLISKTSPLINIRFEFDPIGNFKCYYGHIKRKMYNVLNFDQEEVNNFIYN